MSETKAWGYWATLGWAVLAFFAGQFIGFGLLLWFRAGAWNSFLDTPYDGVLVTLFIVISNPVTIAVLAAAVWLARANPVDYLALHLAGAALCMDRAWRPGRLHRTLRCTALLDRPRAGDAVSTAVLHHRSRGRLAAGHVARRHHCCARGRGGDVPRLSVSRLGAFGSYGVAGDFRDLGAVGRAPYPIRLDRRVADLLHRPVLGLDALEERLDMC